MKCTTRMGVVHDPSPRFCSTSLFSQSLWWMAFALLTSSHSSFSGGKELHFVSLGNHFYLCFGCSWLHGTGPGGMRWGGRYHVTLERSIIHGYSDGFGRCSCNLDRSKETKDIYIYLMSLLRTSFSLCDIGLGPGRMWA